MLISILLCLSISGNNQDAITGSVSMLTNVGPSMGRIGTYGNYASQPVAIKLIFTMDMFLGRIEIYPVLAVLSMLFTRSRK